MASQNYERHIPLEGALNFRDIGGYRTQDGRSVRWRRVFRSGELQHLTDDHVSHLQNKIGINMVLDLRGDAELERFGTGPLAGSGIRYRSHPFTSRGPEQRERFRISSSMGEVYLLILKQEGFGKRLVEALEIIAESDSLPIVYHCTAGKDRTGILTGMLLGALNVGEEQIIHDYALSASSMETLGARLKADPEKAALFSYLPSYAHEAAPESMALLLSSLNREFGSIRGYLESHGGNVSLFNALENALLE